MKYLHKSIARYPCLVLFSSILFSVLLAVIIAATGTLKLVDGTNRDFLVEGETDVIRFDAYTLAKEDASDSSSVDEQSLQDDKWTVIVIYELTDGLTIDSLSSIRQVESAIESIPEWEFVCYKGFSAESKTCAESGQATLSATTAMSGVSNQVGIDTVLSNTGSALSVFFDKDWLSGSETIRYARSIYRVGLPISSSATDVDFSNANDDTEAQEVVVAAWTDALAKYILAEPIEGMDIYFSGTQISSRQVNVLGSKDIQYALGSIIIVFLMIWYHTGSFFLASMGQLEILLSFPIAFFIYRLIFGIKYFQMIHLLTIFIVLGIGADDFFVYIDAWRQAVILSPKTRDDIEERVMYTHSRATGAMFVTTFTTVCAFAASGMSTLLPIASFGIFAALLIASNYVLVCTMFASAVVIYETRFADFSFCQLISKRKLSLDESNSNHDSERSNVLPTDDKEPNFGPTETFLRDTYAPFVNSFKWFIISGFFIWFVVSTYLATQIPALSDKEDWFPDNHAIVVGQNLAKSEFTAAEGTGLMLITLAYGLDGVNRDGSSFFDPSNYGFVEYDSHFDLTSPSSQEYLVSVCDSINATESVYRNREGVAVTCFIWDFREYVQEHGGTFPVGAANFSRTMKSFLTEETIGIEHSLESRVILGNNDEVVVGVITFQLDYDIITPYAIANPVYNSWEDVVTTFNEAAPEGVDNGFQLSFSWAWIRTERAFVRNALQGMLLALLMSGLVLLLSTRNYLVAAIATLCILGTLSSVMSVMYFSGAELGTAESVAVVMLIGFSVDYIVHLGNHFVESEKSTRYERMAHALRDMGISVIFGGLTTLGSAFFLWFATMLFFTKFAYIMTSTVIASWFWSLGFLSAALMAFGPEKGQYDFNFPSFSLLRRKDKSQHLPTL